MIRGILFWSLMILLSFALRRLHPEVGYFPLGMVVTLFVIVFTYDRFLKRKRQQQGPQ